MSACGQCAVHGMLSCQETVGPCGTCGKTGDINRYRATGTPETLCLDCLSAGKHMASAHDRTKADVESITQLGARPVGQGGFEVTWWESAAPGYARLQGVEGPVIVTRDGKDVSEVLENTDEAFRWLLRHQGQSVDYALTHGGYNVRSPGVCRECDQRISYSTGTWQSLEGPAEGHDHQPTSNRYSIAKQVVATHTYMAGPAFEGVMLDATTAGAIVVVCEALSPKNLATVDKVPLDRFITFVWSKVRSA